MKYLGYVIVSISLQECGVSGFVFVSRDMLASVSRSVGYQVLSLRVGIYVSISFQECGVSGFVFVSRDMLASVSRSVGYQILSL